MTQTPPPPPGYDPNMQNPKAAAKAAKAYAKATRPWYKKKRFIIPAALVVLIIIIAASSSGGGSGDSNLKSSPADGGKSNSSNTNGNSGGSGTVGSQSNPAPRGTAVQNESDKYQIDDVQVRDDLGAYADKPQGKYVVITLTVENMKNSSIQISSSDFKLQVNGTEIDPSDNGYMLDDAFSYDDLSPHLKRTGKIVFDVAPKDAGKGVLVAQAELSMDTAVYLSLGK